jgi:hypothetical protein
MMRTLTVAAAFGALICLVACGPNRPEESPIAKEMPITQDIGETAARGEQESGRADAQTPSPSDQQPNPGLDYGGNPPATDLNGNPINQNAQPGVDPATAHIPSAPAPGVQKK